MSPSQGLSFASRLLADPLASWRRSLLTWLSIRAAVGLCDAWRRIYRGGRHSFRTAGRRQQPSEQQRQVLATLPTRLLYILSPAEPLHFHSAAMRKLQLRASTPKR